MNIFGTSFDYQKRLSKVRKLMDEEGMDAILVHSSVNQYYISGMYPHSPWYPVEVCIHTESPLIIFRNKKEEPVYLTTWLTSNGLKEGTWVKDVRVIDKEPFGKKDWWEYTADVLKEKGVDKGTVGIEQDVCVLSTFRKLQSALPEAQFKDADQIFQHVRIIKEPEEIELIKESVLIAEAGLQAGMKAARVGVPESEVQASAEIEMKRRGALREVETMCQSGRRTANHRAFAAKWKKIEENDLVTIDIGCVYKGYGSDITRTWVVGKPTEAQIKIADDMIEIRGKVLNLIKPGVTPRQVHELGNDEMKSAGYLIGKTVLPHGGLGIGGVTIHGIGMGPMHDPPHVDDLDIKLESGMTIAITCCARYVEFTIRFEDNMVIIPGGIELISKLIPWRL